MEMTKKEDVMLIGYLQAHRVMDDSQNGYGIVRSKINLTQQKLYESMPSLIIL